MPYLNQYLQPPQVNYPQGDYRTISRLDRQRAEATKNERLEAELARERQWKDLEFQKRLMELQKNLFGGGGVGSTPGASLQTPAGYGGEAGGSGPGGMMTSMDRMMTQNPQLSNYLGLLGGAKRITGPNANPYALGYNFGTLTGKGGYFGKAAPVPELPGRIGLDEEELVKLLSRLGLGR